MDEQEKVKFEEMYRMVRENNRMLHAARRNAFLGGFFKIIFYAAIVAASVWTYVVYLNPLLTTLMKQLTDVQNMNAQAQQQLGTVQSGAATQLTNVNDMLTKLQAQLKGTKTQ